MARKVRFGVAGKGHVLPELPTMLFTCMGYGFKWYIAFRIWSYIKRYRYSKGMHMVRKKTNLRNKRGLGY